MSLSSAVAIDRFIGGGSMATDQNQIRDSILYGVRHSSPIPAHSGQVRLPGVALGSVHHQGRRIQSETEVGSNEQLT